MPFVFPECQSVFLEYQSIFLECCACLPQVLVYLTPSASLSSLNQVVFRSTSLSSCEYQFVFLEYQSDFLECWSITTSTLLNSLLQGGLPNLPALYVCEPSFPDMLLELAPPTPAFADGAAARPASSGSHAKRSSRAAFAATA